MGQIEPQYRAAQTPLITSPTLRVFVWSSVINRLLAVFGPIKERPKERCHQHPEEGSPRRANPNSCFRVYQRRCKPILAPITPLLSGLQKIAKKQKSRGKRPKV